MCKSLILDSLLSSILWDWSGCIMALPGFRRYTRLDTRLELQPMSVVIGKKKKPSSRRWMRFDTEGLSEILELDRNTLVSRVGIPARDLRILGPIFAQSSSILARERAMVVNLEFIRAIITADEVLVLHSQTSQVTKFVEQLRKQLLVKNFPVPAEAAGEVLPEQLPFEFRVLEIALEVVCSYLDAKVVDLERDAYFAVEELTRGVSTKKLEHVRTVKNDLTRLTARVQKVREELEQLLDDDDDMADLYLTRKLMQWQTVGSPSESETGGKDLALPENQADNHHLNGSATVVTTSTVSGNGVEELEMLLELYFMQTDRNLNKLAMLREYIHDTENYINIQLDSKRNELMQLELVVVTASLCIAFSTAVYSACSMNLQSVLYRSDVWFPTVVIASLVTSVLLFVFVMIYARRKKLLGA